MTTKGTGIVFEVFFGDGEAITADNYFPAIWAVGVFTPVTRHIAGVDEL